MTIHPMSFPSSTNTFNTASPIHKAIFMRCYYFNVILSATKIKQLHIFHKITNGTWHDSIISVTGNESQGSLVTFNLHLT